MNHRHEIVRLSSSMTEREIARHLSLSPSVVHYWIERDGRARPTKSGRPRATDRVADDIIQQSIVSNPFTSAVQIRRDNALTCSVQTIRNRIRASGYKCRVPARKPFLRPIHKSKRLTFASNHLHWRPEHEWSRVIFSDEKIFRSDGNGPLRVYRPEGNHRFDDEYMHTTGAGGTSKFTICVWFAFCRTASFRRIHLVERPTLDAEYYITRILDPVKRYLRRWDYTFMQDLSPIHTSRAVAAWMDRNNVKLMTDWPPKGPDMNPVENVWAELVRLSEQQPAPSNRRELWENVQTAMNLLEDDYFDQLIDSMPRRMETVVIKQGGWTKY